MVVFSEMGKTSGAPWCEGKCAQCPFGGAAMAAWMARAVGCQLSLSRGCPEILTVSGRDHDRTATANTLTGCTC